MPPDEPADGPPEWNQDDADWLIGKYVLVGMTYLEADGETVTSQVQCHGRIVSADRENGFKIECEGKGAGRTMGLPPTLGAFHVADKGEYSLRSTGEIVKDPDMLATWSITAAPKAS